ncbi:MAG TPA: 23S rRNA (adenine(2030)-N(6))-methyltransferase RlmJ [Hyphomonadaceae bacterium]|nr:23S rRNA (adenine(2030)-N(6))-methyltransferase RlmJ [Hyphomonadaceae bacterium]
MNYRHAFHVGNHGDVLKHVALVFCLEALKRKPSSFAALDTHAGRGMYDLTAAEAVRSPEWTGGIGRLWGQEGLPEPLARYLAAVAAHNLGGDLRFYPGSPEFIAAALREGDELHACELHPEEYAALRRSLGRAPGVRLHERDGYEALAALLPPAQRRGLVLIDPPYEAPDELACALAAIKGALTRFGHGICLWWRPLKSASALAAADAELMSAGIVRSALRADLWVDAPRPEGRLTGSSILLVNPPFGIEAALREALPALAGLLAAGASGWSLRGLD